MTQVQANGAATMFDAITRLDRDLKAASQVLGPREARYLTDLYYQIQDFRKISANQTRAQEGVEPNRLTIWVFEQMERLENNIKRALDEYTKAYMVGRWMQSIVGIGPVISAGMMSHLDIRRARTPGHFYRFAGYDPTRIWLGKERSKRIVHGILGDGERASDQQLSLIVQAVNRVGREEDPTADEDLVGWSVAELVAKLRDKEGKAQTPTKTRLCAVLARCPWNADLKCLCYKAGDCFVKFQNNANDSYGRLYVQRKAYEAQLNERGAYASQARRSLAEKNYGADTEARKHYEAGKLPPARLHMRALRWAVKMFLSHLHRVMHLDFYGTEPPPPYPIAHEIGDHRHIEPTPNWPFEGGGKSLRELYAQP